MFKRIGFSSSSSSSSSSPAPDSGSDKEQVKYKGVRLRKWGKWVSEIRLPNSRERIWLGSYDSAEKAARAFDAAQFCLRGPNANFNFQDSPHMEFLGSRTSPLTPAEIQEFASRYANNGNDDQEHEQQRGISSSAHHQQANDQTDHTMNAQVDDGFGFYPNPTMPTVSSISDGAFRMDTLDWHSPYYDNMLETNPHHAIVAQGPSSGNLPDYDLMLSSLDHMHEDMYMTPHLGTKFDDCNAQDEQNLDDYECYSQQSFLWNF